MCSELVFVLNQNQCSFSVRIRSKAQLDTQVEPGAATRSFPNDAAGQRAARDWLRKLGLTSPLENSRSLGFSRSFSDLGFRNWRFTGYRSG